MNTIESNKLIAKFMGLGDNQPYQLWEHIRSNAGGEETSLYFDNNLRYNSSYDWLMPVVHKIKQLGESENVYSVEFEKLKLTDPIERIYKVVIEFIQWYNKLGRKLP